MLLATLVVSFILTVIGIPAFIRFYQRAHISGQQMHEDVKQHQAKAGTPTMGGVVFLITSVFVTLVFSFLTGNFTRPVQLILFILVLYGIVGFLDDFLKVFRKINEGLNPKQKLALQLLGGSFSISSLNAMELVVFSMSLVGISIWDISILYLPCSG